MSRILAHRRLVTVWQKLGTRFLPFADAATVDLPLGRLLRLALFQVSAGCIMVLLNGTLNRVLIVELGVPVALVSAVIAIPVLAAPLRLFFGYRSDTYRSVLGWRRVPYVWMGSMLQFGGLAIMPFALLLLQSQTVGPEWAGAAGACLPSCSAASACTWRRRRGWRSQATSRRKTSARASWRSSTSCCSPA